MRQEDRPQANAECMLCGKKYYVCRPCLKNKDKGIYGWRLFACCPQCYQIYVSMNAYKEGKMSKEEVLRVIDGIARFDAIPRMIPPYDAIYNEITGKHSLETLQKTEIAEENKIEFQNYENRSNYKNGFKKNKHGKR